MILKSKSVYLKAAALLTPLQCELQNEGQQRAGQALRCQKIQKCAFDSLKNIDETIDHIQMQWYAMKCLSHHYENKKERQLPDEHENQQQWSCSSTCCHQMRIKYCQIQLTARFTRGSFELRGDPHQTKFLVPCGCVRVCSINSMGAKMTTCHGWQHSVLCCIPGSDATCRSALLAHWHFDPREQSGRLIVLQNLRLIRLLVVLLEGAPLAGCVCVSLIPAGASTAQHRRFDSKSGRFTKTFHEMCIEISERKKTLGSPKWASKKKTKSRNLLGDLWRPVKRQAHDNFMSSEASWQPNVSFSQNSLIALPADGVSHTTACHLSNHAVTVGLSSLISA